MMALKITNRGEHLIYGSEDGVVMSSIKVSDNEFWYLTTIYKYDQQCFVASDYLYQRLPHAFRVHALSSHTKFKQLKKSKNNESDETHNIDKFYNLIPMCNIASVVSRYLSATFDQNRDHYINLLHNRVEFSDEFVSAISARIVNKIEAAPLMAYLHACIGIFNNVELFVGFTTYYGVDFNICKVISYKKEYTAMKKILQSPYRYKMLAYMDADVDADIKNFIETSELFSNSEYPVASLH